MAADYDTKVYIEVGGDKLVVADGGEIELQDGAVFDVQSGVDFDLGSFGTSMVVNQTDNYPLGVFGVISTAQTTGSTTQRGIWSRMDVDANLSGTASVTGAELQFRYDGATSIGSGTEAEQYSGAWLYFEQDTSGDTLADYCHASAAFASVETHSDLSLSANTHLSGIEIASRLGASDGVAWADTTGTTAALFITKAPAATGVTASNWPYGIVIENVTTAIDVAACTTGINLGGAMTDGILIAGACGADAIRISGQCTAKALHVTGAYTTGISLAADGTTGLEITSAFDGTDMIVLAGTATGYGIDLGDSTCTTADLLLQDGGTINDGATPTGGSGDALAITQDAIQLTGKVEVGKAWGTDGAGAIDVTTAGAGWDWAFQANAVLEDDVAGTAVAGAYHSLAVAVTQTGSTSVFGTWTDLVFSDSVDYSAADNAAAIWAQFEAGASFTAPATAGDFAAAIYANVKSGATFTTGASAVVNGIRVQSEVSTTTISHDGRLAAFECLQKSGSYQPWDYGLYMASATTGIYIGDVGATSEHFLDMTDAYLGLVIETGTYQSSADGGVTLSDSNTRPVSFLFDDSAAALTGNNRAVLSRVYLAESQGAGGTIVSLQGQLKIADNKDFSAGRFCGVDGYMEFGGTTTINTGSYVSAMNARVDVAASETVTVASGGILCGIHVHTTGTGTLTSTGSSYGIYINDQGTVDDWKVGVGINNSTTGIDIGACTTAGINIATGQVTGINIAGTCSTAGISMGALTTGNQAMLVTWSGTADEATAVAAGVVSVTATSTANGSTDKDLLIGYHAAVTTGTIDQANNILVGMDGYVESKHNIDSMAGGRFTAVLNDAAGTIDAGVGAVYAVCTVTGAATVSAGPVTGVWSQYDGAAAITTAETSCFFGDIDEDIDKGLDFDVADGKTCATGIALGVTSTGTYTIGIDIGACTTGISFSGATVTEGIDFSGLTYSPDANRTNYAIGIGSRADELTVNLANAASQNFEPFQMNINFTATAGAPTSTSTARLIRVRSTHDTADMADLRIMNINTYMDVRKNIQAAYGQMNGVDFATNAITVTTEAAVGVFNMDCVSGATVTGDVRGIIINLHGAALPSTTSIGLEVRSDGGAATLAEGIRVWGVGSCQLTTGLKMQGTLATCFDFENVVTGCDDTDSEGSRNGRILVKDKNGDTKYILLYDGS